MTVGLESAISRIENLLKQIKGSKTSQIDGMVLGTALELVYRCGLRRREIPLIKISDITYSPDNQPMGLKISGASDVPLSDEGKVIIQKYLQYLTTNYSISTNDPLFPGYNNVRIIVRHINTFSQRDSIREIHNIGVKKHYISNKDQSTDKRSKSTGQQFRMSSRAVQDLVHDRIQPPGRSKADTISDRKYDLFVDILGLIDEIVVANDFTELLQINYKIYILAKSELFTARDKKAINKLKVKEARETIELIKNRIEREKEISKTEKKEILRNAEGRKMIFDLKKMGIGTDYTASPVEIIDILKKYNKD